MAETCYFDTFVGLIPCSIIEEITDQESLNSRDHWFDRPPMRLVRLNADSAHGAYKKNEEIVTPVGKIVNITRRTMYSTFVTTAPIREKIPK